MLEERQLLHAQALEPTSFEQYQLELVNRARAFPSAEVAEANVWVDRKEAEFGNRALFDWDGTPGLNEGLNPPTITTDAKQPLAFNLNAIHAARDYSQQLLAGNAFSHSAYTHHDGTGTATGKGRVNAAGVAVASVSENLGVSQQSISYPISRLSAEDLHFGLFIDGDVTGRGHRVSLMNDTHREVGIGLASSTTYNRPGGGDDCCPHAVLVTQNFFTRSGFVFLTGAVYSDTVLNDDFYTPGEGTDDVTITATPMAGGAPISTMTFGSGGYSLQLADGLYRIQATGPFGTTPERLVQIDGRNLKLDVIDGSIVVNQAILADFGDAPSSYATTSASNGPLHVLGDGLILGAAVDAESNGQPNANATGDDLAGTDDENGVTFGTLRQGRPGAITVVASAAGKLDAFVDFNADGDFADVGEKIFHNLAVGAGTNSLTFSVPATAAASDTFARFRISSAGGLSFTGAATGGEVEDYAVEIRQGTDLSDAPNSYRTTLASNGARHLLGSPLFLGAVVDGDSDGQPNTSASGDDNNFAPDDEDGVTFGTLRQGRPGGVTVVASAAGRLDAFVDFNADGDFADAGEKIFHNLLVAAGSNSLGFNVPSTAPAGNTFARFRLSNVGGLSFDGLATSGEVEDHVVQIKTGTDLGDAPNTYATTLASNGARHLLGSPLFLGAVVDGDVDGLPNVTATGDDTSAFPDDEDGVTFGALRQGRLVSAAVQASAAGRLDAFVDFNADGDFADAGEKIFHNVAVAAGSTVLTFNVPSTAAVSSTFARFRISNVGGLSFDGLANNGEVEDYAVQIKQGTDLGDAPNSYLTTLASNGPRHLLGSLLFLGTVVDGDTDGQPDATATGDDRNGASDDEDGVTFGTLIRGAPATVTVVASAAGRLDAFLDFDADGNFADAGEKIINNMAVVAGTNILPFTVPLTATAGSTFARLRLSTIGGLTFNGLAADGEVEDHQVAIAAPLQAAGGEASPESRVESLEPDQLAPILDAAIMRFAAQGLSPQQLNALSSVTFAIADLPGATLGLATPGAITLDATAAGYGWFIDPTPLDDDEFSSGSRLSALDSQLRVDLLTAVMHELGHTLGWADEHSVDSADDLMHDELAIGQRRTSHAVATDAVLGGSGL